MIGCIVCIARGYSSSVTFRTPACDTVGTPLLIRELIRPTVEAHLLERCLRAIVDVRLAEHACDDARERREVAVLVLAQLLDDVLHRYAMPQRQRDSTRQCTVRRVIKKIDDVTEYELIVVTKRYLHVVRRDASHATVLDQRPTLRFLWDLDAL